jgi:plastocyanin
MGLRKGDKLRLTAFYDAQNMHVRAMGIMHVYMAPRVRGFNASKCPPLPPDRVEEQQKPQPSRALPPAVKVPLTGIGSDGLARSIEKPPGPMRTLRGKRSLTISIRGESLSPGNLTVPTGTLLRWRFGDEKRHDVTVADGPFGFSSQPMSRGLTFSRRLNRPGVYKLFCSLHPVAMTQRVVVRGSR